jgi:uncharacterized protein involved in propanediol utilization
VVLLFNVMNFKLGFGRATAHHGELFQGQVEDEYGRLRRCLVSLPCNRLYSEAVFSPDISGTLVVCPDSKEKTRRVAELTRAYFGLGHIGGRIVTTSNIIEGKGYGSSTADCVATVRAIADALHCSLTPQETAQLVVDAETASDNIMFAHAVLFAQREGIVLEDFEQSIPALEVIGIDTDRHGIVDTLAYPPAEYDWQEIQTFRVLLGALRRAIRAQDKSLLGRVATASARVNERFLRKYLFDEILELSNRIGTLGIAVAHSGTVLSILLDPDDESVEHKVDILMLELDTLGFRDLFRFRTDCMQPRVSASV